MYTSYLEHASRVGTIAPLTTRGRPVYSETFPVIVLERSNSTAKLIFIGQYLGVHTKEGRETFDGGHVQDDERCCGGSGETGQAATVADAGEVSCQPKGGAATVFW